MPNVRFLAIVSLVSLIAHTAASQTNVGGKASGLWTAAGSPYRFLGYVVVQDGELLEIEEGAEIQLLNRGLYVGYQTAGELQARGVRVVGPGEVRFYSNASVPYRGPGWLEESEFVEGATVSFLNGTVPGFEGNVGLASISLGTQPMSLSTTWELTNWGVPYRLGAAVEVEPEGRLVADGVTILGNTTITFRAPTELQNGNPEPSRIVNSDFSKGPVIVIYPGANLQLQDNIGIPSVTLPSTLINGPGDYVLQDYGLP